ncbi:ABC transporter substrate-binding protein [Actinoplanes regularis]|uniref:Carbohydrate ABC transporter substrate-binding protein, CUT1 family n=1 Tax=Actinoplanes regularis TaxID=52697 RepID=A0A238W7F6_9ACTN|nr:extracellular solute-binding protein [Actinoplanes regularis]GIE85251.1 sugar ABC transporter substrate-binding protein [Actinoplanes regularis]GLW27440.1 sugar ABC transporter substrate-binding protein [Actinoplanes regularis]SNR41629.1 carbohydrate ABC transporter substrate-binding protein, CUT1 family [Actinoplanes regularis]
MSVSRRTLLRGGLAGLALAGTGTAAAGCGDSGDDGKTLRFAWWGSEERAAATQKVVDLFHTKHPDITIKTTYSAFDPYFQKLATEMSGGNAPDVLQMSERYVREYAERNTLLDLTPHLGSKVQTADLEQKLFTQGVIGGKTYGLPMGQTTHVLQYDAKRWTEAGAKLPAEGWTWDDLRDAGAKVSAKFGPKVSGISDFFGIEDWFGDWLRQQGKDLYTADGKLGYTEAEVIRWWQMSVDFTKAKALTPPAVTSNTTNTPFPRKESTAEFSPDSTIGMKSWDNYGSEFKLSAFPTAGTGIGQFTQPPMMISVAQRTKNQDAALAFVDFFLNDPEAGALLGMARGLPPNLKIRETLSGTLTDEWKTVADYEALVGPKLLPAPPPPPKGAGVVKTQFQLIYDDVMNGKATPEKAAPRLMSEIQQALGA